MLLKKIIFYFQKVFFYGLWNHLPRKVQFVFSKHLSEFLKSPLSKSIIPQFCDRYKISEGDLGRFKPASGKNSYQSFQDFFTRKMIQLPPLTAKMIWPCEGFVCDQIKQISHMSDGISTYVKGQKANICDIFNLKETESLKNYHFVNIFLHNHNYHRFHVPVTSRVEEVIHIPGKLQILRPWFYDLKHVNEPSFLNERVIIKLRDIENRLWHLALVAGMGVGHVQLNEKCKPGHVFNLGDEIGMFLLGSTCCMAIPQELSILKSMTLVNVCDPLPVVSNKKRFINNSQNSHDIEKSMSF